MALIAHWPLNGDILDYSGNGFHLTNNGATINNEGKIGKCYEFNGTNNYLNLNKFPLYQEEEITFSFWCYLKSNSTQNFLCSREAVGNGFCIFYISNGIRFDFGSQWQIPNSNLELNKWHHCVFIRNKNKRKFYLNGQFIEETNAFGDFNTQVLNRFSIGASYPASYANFLNGKLNDIKLFNHELSKKEIKELYQTKILDWKFNECEEPTINLFPSNLQNYNYELNSIGGFVTQLSGNNNYLKIINEQGPCFNKILEYKGNNRIYKKVDVLKNKIYTVSAWIYSDVPMDNVFRYELNGGDYSWTAKNISHKGNGWEYLSLTTDLLTCNTTLYIFFYGNINQIKKIDSIQLEEKNYSTPFIIKERKGKVVDSSGYKNHGLIELNSSPKWFNTNEYEFDGINDCIKITSDNLKNLFNSNNFTVELKCKFYNLNKTDLIFNIGAAAVNSQLHIGKRENNKFTFAFYSNDLDSNQNIEINKWYHFVLKNENGKKSIFINGIKDKEVLQNNLTLTQNELYIGKRSSSDNYAKFNLSKIKIFATALSEQDIKELYENSMTIDKNNNVICNEINEFSKNNIFNFNDLINSSNSRNEIIKINENNSFKTISKVDDGFANIFNLINSIPRNKTIIFEFFITKIKNKLSTSNNNEAEIQFFLFDKISYTSNRNVQINITELNKKKFCSLEIVNDFCDFATAIRLDNNHIGAEYIIEDLNIYIKEEKNNSFIEKNGILNKNINENIIFKNTNLLDYTLWKDGQINSIGNFNKNGNTNDDCKRIIKTNPLNQKDIIWACESNDVGNTDSDGTGPDGGWNTNFINIDNTKTYRMSVWIKRENMGSGSGSIYFGPTNSNVDNERIYNFNNTANTNPYFYSSNTNSFNNEWILYISYVFPNSSTQIPINDAGGYNIFGNKVIIFDSSRFFKFGPNTTKLKHRTYLYYSSKTDERVYWYRPRIDLVNGEEPSINELIRCGEHPPLLNFDYNIFNNNVLTKINKNNELICNTISEV